MAERVRADALRNRERLLEVARRRSPPATSRSRWRPSPATPGSGIGTLYRHFPSREALTEAVYRTELAEVAASAAQLLDQHPPAIALRRWMDRYAGFVAAKRGMAESLRVMFESGAVEPATPESASSAPSTCC